MVQRNLKEHIMEQESAQISEQSPTQQPPLLPTTGASIPRKSNKKTAFAILGITLALMFILGTVYLYRLQQKNGIPESVSVITPTPITDKKFTNIAYLNITDGQQIPTLVIYNTETKEKKTDFPKLEFADKVTFNVGQWSPDGRYLPIVASSWIGDSFQDGESYFFFYDSVANDLIEAVHAASNNTLDNRWMDIGYLDFTGSWITNTDFFVNFNYSKYTSQKLIEITYLNVSGAISTKIIPETNSPNVEGIQMTSRSNKLEYKSKSTTLTPSTFYGISYEGKKYVPNLVNNQPIGVLDENLVTLYTPRGLNFLTDAEKFKDLEKLSPEEQLQKSTDLLLPKGQDKLIFSDSTGKLVKEIQLPYTDWKSEDVVILDDSRIIVYQSERAIAPTKERYLTISKDEKVDVLYERAIPSSLKEKASFSDIKILLTNNQSHLYLSDVDSRNSISILDISTKTISPFCTNCSGLKVNNPWLPRTSY
jgi:hypothetical protein